MKFQILSVAGVVAIALIVSPASAVYLGLQVFLQRVFLRPAAPHNPDQKDLAAPEYSPWA